MSVRRAVLLRTCSRLTTPAPPLRALGGRRAGGRGRPRWGGPALGASRRPAPRIRSPWASTASAAAWEASRPLMDSLTAGIEPGRRSPASDRARPAAGARRGRCQPRRRARPADRTELLPRRHRGSGRGRQGGGSRRAGPPPGCPVGRHAYCARSFVPIERSPPLAPAAEPREPLPAPPHIAPSSRGSATGTPRAASLPARFPAGPSPNGAPPPSRPSAPSP